MTVGKLTNTLLLIIAAVVVATALRFTSQVLVPLAVAIIFLFVFTPLIQFLQRRWHFPAALSILLVMVFFITLGGLIGVLLFSSVRSLIGQYGFYQERFQLLFETLVTRYNFSESRMSEFTNSLGLSQALRQFLISFSGNILSFVSGFTLVVIFLFFLLIEHRSISNRIDKAFNAQQGRHIKNATYLIYRRIGRYLTTKVLISMLTGVLMFIIFSIIGIDFPVVWGMLAFLFNFIPSIGSLVISALSILFAIIQFAPTWPPIIAAAVATVAAQFSIGNILEPKLLGDSLNLSPVVIILSLLIWGYLWGVAGMFLAVPLTVVIKNTLEHIPLVKPLGIMMGSSHRHAARTRRSRKRGSSVRG